jgi:hypothetical protein
LRADRKRQLFTPWPTPEYSSEAVAALAEPGAQEAATNPTLLWTAALAAEPRVVAEEAVVVQWVLAAEVAEAVTAEPVVAVEAVP